MINARSEEAPAKPAFRQAFRHRRCLVPCSGFYEWKAVQGAPKRAKKQAYVFRKSDGGTFALGGLWEQWCGPEGNRIDSFAILTAAANEVVAHVHDRMPAIIHRSDYASWLDPKMSDIDEIERQLCAQSPRLVCLPVEVA